MKVKKLVVFSLLALSILMLSSAAVSARTPYCSSVISVCTGIGYYVEHEGYVENSDCPAYAWGTRLAYEVTCRENLGAVGWSGQCCDYDKTADGYFY